MKKNYIIIQGVLPGSIAEEAGIEQGDMLISIDNIEIKDVFDYRFLSANENLVLAVQKKNSEILEVEIEKDEYEDLGMEFENGLMDTPKSCTNKCIFCFIDQLPKGMRKTLYFKDDDPRLSFLTGNYVTLTNTDSDDINRIIRYRMSPVNISVHTTNPDLRVCMLNNRLAGDITAIITNLVKGGIAVNCQIVLCRGINDGIELDNTISTLTGFYPGVRSISVVPVGLTKHRKGLYELIPYDRDSSAGVIVQVENWQKRLRKICGSSVVYPADEFYIMAGCDIPDYVKYDDFPQIENGVGLVAMLKHEFTGYLHNLDYAGNKHRKVSIATGVSSSRYIRELTGLLERKYDNIKVNVYEIKNSFFGENVTVTGLLTGTDIACRLEGKELGDELLICRCMLKSGEDLFLDGFTVDMLRKRLNTAIRVVENNGRDLVDRILGGDGIG